MYLWHKNIAFLYVISLPPLWFFYCQNCGIVIRSNKIVSSCILKFFITWHSFFQRRPPTVSVDINMRVCVLLWLIENNSAIFNTYFEFTYNCLVNLKTWLKRGSWIAIRSFDVSFHEVFNMFVWNTCRFTGKFTLCEEEIKGFITALMVFLTKLTTI